MITFLIEMLEFPNFGRMTTPTILFNLRNKIWSVTLWAKIMTS